MEPASSGWIIHRSFDVQTLIVAKLNKTWTQVLGDVITAVFAYPVVGIKDGLMIFSTGTSTMSVKDSSTQSQTLHSLTYQGVQIQDPQHR